MCYHTACPLYRVRAWKLSLGLYSIGSLPSDKNSEFGFEPQFNFLYSTADAEKKLQNFCGPDG